MKPFILAIILSLPATLYAQTDTTYWNKGGKFGANVSQATLTNWSAGGSNTIAGAVYFNYIFDYKKRDILWQNTIDMGIGWIKEARSAQKKADDRMVLTSSFGKKLTSSNDHWYYNATADFRTQFAKGYNVEDDPNQNRPISKFISPGYLMTSIGIDYRPNDYFNVAISPITGKFTFVQDDSLSTAGAFGVDPGEKFRAELGMSLKASFNKEIVSNVLYTTNLLLFSDYLEHPDKIDVNWENILTLKVNGWLSANIYNQIIYDYDIKFYELDPLTGENDLTTETDKWQFKNIIGLGLAVQFGGKRGEKK
ncbi:Protein of unknown function [Reichenbachiella faecimaris]|uniref:DUF3078 domain-containing protein n=1 Tax=Reichenbachiella faecimaris TaxID=692418 RepID=A0A1W2G9E6_REIFA|nr:DUF3078 domain-containing protein [Reichenbachiella faecimaris]SMD33221.1 Protein of unknown function [Reichenbachiella faecimaris]